MDKDNYVTVGELEQILRVARFWNDLGDSTKPEDGRVSFSVTMFDINGESLGVVDLTDSPEYGYFPNKEKADD